ncbi:MAG: 16S rRNA (cytosine(1402)-N(4))-methyltransferase RsmH [Acidobacteriota bacterium]|nr:MAG: 16S rRNA (cytosine(1402)-N(4))-methyltransferase RsmH [Acidobacteriota bacterium]
MHIPVLCEEVIHLLDVGSGGFFVDATLGVGGHSEAILQANAACTVLGIDQDPIALEMAMSRLSRFGDRFTAVRSNFEDMSKIIAAKGAGQPRGIVADIGVSSLQLDDPARGFSFRYDAPLDMRMSADSGGQTAAEMIDQMSEAEIADIIYLYGEERFSRRIARRIVERREAGTPVATTFELASLVRSAVPKSKKEKIDPATRTFQALRIAVNRELDVLEPFIRDSIDVIAPGGVLAIITFHSLEDRIVKHTFQRLSGKCVCPRRAPVCSCGAVKAGEILTKKPITASEAEMAINPRSRSAKLRGFKKFETNN